MNYVFHGSKKGDLKEIRPNISTHQQNLVYATKSPCIATIFLNNGGSDLTYALGGQGTKDNPAYLVERLPNVFDKIFSDKGSIYTLAGEKFSQKDGFWSAEVVAEGSQAVLKEEKIENILDKLNEYVKDSTLILYMYPNRPEFIPTDNSDLIDKYIKFYKMGHKDSIEQLLTYYPEFANEIKSRLDKKTH